MVAAEQLAAAAAEAALLEHTRWHRSCVSGGTEPTAPGLTASEIDRLLRGKAIDVRTHMDHAEGSCLGTSMHVLALHGIEA